MREWAFGQPLATGTWGIREPMPDAPEVWPDILLVPLACFDRKGNRIGYGAGYYDLTINRLRVLKPVVAIGLAYHAQHVAVVPFTPRDARLDLVLTERELIDCGGSSMRILFVGDVVGRSGRAASARPAAGADRGSGSSTWWSSTARTRPAASASPRRSTRT